MIYFIWGSGGLLPGHSVWTLWLKNIQYCLDHHHKVWGWTKEAFRSVSLERCSTNTSIYEKYYHGGCLELFAVWRGCGFNHYWCFKVTMVLFTLSHSHLMDLNSSPGLITRLFEFGMWAQASRCLHHCGATMVTFIPHMSTGVKMLPPLQGHNDHIYSITFFPMDPKLSLSLRAGPFEFGMWAQVSRCCHCCKAMMIAFVPLHSHLMDSKLPLHLGIKPFKFGMWAQVLRCCHHYQWIQNCLWVWWWEFGMQAQASRCCHHCKATIITFIPLHSCLMDPKLSLSLMTTPFKFWMQAQALMCCHYCNIMIKTFYLLHSHLMDPKSSPSLIMVPFKFGMWVQGSNFFHHSQQQLMMYSSLHQTVESFPLTRAWGGLQIQILVIVWAGSLLAIHIIIGAFAALVVLDGLETSSSTHL